jgi:hypothetical protein
MTLAEIEGETAPGETAPADAHDPGAAAGPPAAAPHPHTGSASLGKQGPGWLGVEQIAFIALLMLAIGGMAVTDYSARSGLSYWLVVIPLFGAVSVFNGWRSARADGKNVEEFFWILLIPTALVGVVVVWQQQRKS